MITCPDIKLPEWKKLITDLGDIDKAYLAYFRNGNEIPSLEEARELLNEKTPDVRSKEIEKELKSLNKELERVKEKKEPVKKERVLKSKFGKDEFGKGKLVYGDPTIGKTESTKLSSKLVDFDDLLSEVANKLVLQNPDYSIIKEALKSGNTYNIGWALTEQLYNTNKSLFDNIYKEALQKALQLNNEGISVFGGNSIVLRNADMIVTYGKKMTEAIIEEQTKRGVKYANAVPKLQEKVLKHIKDNPMKNVTYLAPGMKLSDVIFEPETGKESNVPDHKVINDAANEFIKDIDSALKVNESIKKCK
jgi:hypothetical protein